MRAIPWSGRRSEAGASLVEFALIVPLLLTLLLGTVTGGFALAKKNSMTNAVREGARFGATLSGTADWDAWAADVRDRTDELAANDLDAGEICVEMINVTSGGDVVLGRWPTTGCALSATAPSTPTSASVGTCIVKVWGQTTAPFHALVYNRTLTIDGTALGQYERPDCP